MLYDLKFQHSESAVKSSSRGKPLTLVAFNLVFYLLQQSVKAIFPEV